jgi:DMSO/TMAO reductase YedYZ molybdopterin-dependent catalytic subunit
MSIKPPLPPGQFRTDGFPILNCGPIPTFNPATWDFRIWGAVEEPYSLSWDQLMTLPRVHVQMDLHCVTKWSKIKTDWEGIAVKTLIEHGFLKPKPQAKFVMQHADFGYTTNLPLAVILQENFLLATHFDGKPLTPEHGYPLRGVIGAIPGAKGIKDLYLWKGAKWLRGLEFMEEDRPGFWEANGYHNEGDVWLEQRFMRSGENE